MKRLSFAAGAVVAGVAVGALLLGLPGVHAEGGIVAVHATDSGYQGVPGSLKAGEARFSFKNDSTTEAHEMNLFRINDGVTESFDQILAEELPGNPRTALHHQMVHLKSSQRR